MADCRHVEPFCIPPVSLVAHRQWLATSGGLGTRLTLRGDYSGANLTGADMRKADLKGVNLRGADLTGAKLQGADLTGANLHDANLANADLTDAHGLRENKTGGAHLLGGANLSGATLPEDVAKFDGLANVEELSKNAGKLFISMLSADALMQLIIAQTTDVQLMTASGTTKIPVLDADIPITTLFWLGPLVLYGLYFAFHLYLQRLWETLASLPAIFPDGMLLPQKSYPWLLNDMVGLWSPHLKTRTPPLARSQEILFAFLAYSLVPMSLFPFWARYLIRHDWRVTAVHILLVTVFLWSQMMFFFLARATLRRNTAVSDWGRAPWWKHDWWKHDWWKHKGQIKAGRLLAPMMLCLAWGMCFSAVSVYAINWGVPRQIYTEATPESQKDPNDPNKITNQRMIDLWNKRHPHLGVYDPRQWVPWLLGEIGYSPFSSLEQAELSTKPEGWTDTDKDKIISVHKPVRLKNTNLRYADLLNAFLVKADLSHSDLEDGDLRAADLRGAEMEWADLHGADLNQGVVGGSSVPTLLKGADLQHADLSEADLQQADLTGADLRQANLSEAGLQSAILFTAILDRADLTDAEFQSADLQGAFLKHARLGRANLTGALLQGADLTDAHLENADLTGASLEGTVLTGITYNSGTKWPSGFHPPKSADTKKTKIKPALPASGRRP